MAAACEQFVNARVDEPRQQRLHARLVGVLLAAPFLGAGSAVMLATVHLGAAETVAAIFALFGAGWLGAMLVATTANVRLVGTAALIFATIGVATLIAAAGGPASPVALLCVALPLEVYWVSASRRLALRACLAVPAALGLAVALGWMLPAGGQPVAWHWLVPLAWAATWVARAGRMQDDAELHEDDEVEERLIDTVDAVIFRIAPGGDVLEASAKASTILDLAPAMWLGSGLFDRVHLADRVAYLSALADLREGAQLRRLEIRLRLPSQAGTIGDNYRNVMLELMRCGADRPFIAMVRDNETVARLRSVLADAEEMAASADVAKGRFLAAVSHELRTPLNVILGFSDMLLHEMFGPFADPRQKEYVSLIRSSGQHLLDVVTSILDISRLESGTYAALPEPFPFGDAVEMCRSMMSLPAAKKNIALSAQVAADVGEINADRRAVQQILINLTSNAIKFTPEGGEVTIGAKRVGSRLHMWVSDNGIGIAQADMANLGKPFTQVQNDYTRRYEGTGLGLSLVKGLVALHDGTMTIESALGEGTRVDISLPVEGPQEKDEPVVVPMLGTRNAKEVSDGPTRRTA